MQLRVQRRVEPNQQPGSTNTTQCITVQAGGQVRGGSQGGVSLPQNVSQYRLEVREGCHYHSMYHSAGWRSGRGVTTTQYITVQAGGQVSEHQGGVSLTTQCMTV